MMLPDNTNLTSASAPTSRRWQASDLHRAIQARFALNFARADSIAHDVLAELQHLRRRHREAAAAADTPFLALCADHLGVLAGHLKIDRLTDLAAAFTTQTTAGENAPAGRTLDQVVEYVCEQLGTGTAGDT